MLPSASVICDWACRELLQLCQLGCQLVPALWICCLPVRAGRQHIKVRAPVKEILPLCETLSHMFWVPILVRIIFCVPKRAKLAGNVCTQPTGSNQPQLHMQIRSMANTGLLFYQTVLALSEAVDTAGDAACASLRGSQAPSTLSWQMLPSAACEPMENHQACKEPHIKARHYASATANLQKI